MPHKVEKSQNCFVGRARELTALDEALTEALSGRGRLVLISGEPGIGKTRLADEFSAQAAFRGACVFSGRCWEGEGAPPYWPIIQIVRALIARDDLKPALAAFPVESLTHIASIVPEVRQHAASNIPETHTTPPSDGARSRFELFDAVTKLLQAFAARLPMVLLIDDLHDADLSSLQLVAFIARGLKDSRVMLLGTHRDAEVRRSAELSKHIGELHREGITLPLGGLSRSEVAEFIETRAGSTAPEDLVAKMYTATDGNPLFVGGLVRLMLADPEHSTPGADFEVPDEVRESIRRRLAMLPRRLNERLAIGSAIGNEFELAIIEKIDEAHSDELLSDLGLAERAGIVVRIGDTRVRWRFGHALIRNVLYESIGIEERTRLHRKIGEAIEARGAAEQNARLEELARHFLAAGIADKAIDYCIRSGYKAVSIFAYEAAVAYFQDAFATTELIEKGTPRQAGLLAEIGYYAKHLDTLKAIASYEAATSIFEVLCDFDHAAEMRIELGNVLDLSGPYQDSARALALFRRAEPIVRKRSDKTMLGACLHGLSTVSRMRFRIRDSLRYMSEAMDAALEAKADVIDLWCSSAAQYCSDLCHAGRLTESIQLLALIREKAAAIEAKGWPNRLNLLGVKVWCGDTLAMLGDLPGTLEWWKLGASDAILDEAQRKTIANNEAFTMTRMGDLERARQLAAEAGTFIGFYPSGDWAASWNSALDWHKSHRDAWVIMDIVARHFDPARSARALGNFEQACNLLENFLRGFPPDEPYPSVEMHIRPELALQYIEMGRPDLASEQVSRCDAIVAEGEDWRGLKGHFLFARGALAGVKGDYMEADRHFASAVEIYRRFKLAWHESDALHYWGRMLLAAGERDLATQKFDLSVGNYRRIGAGQPWIDRVAVDRAKAEKPTSVSHLGRANACTFHREGDVWTVSHREHTFRLKDMKGLHYIAHLLAHPGESWHVRDLIALTDGEDAPAAAQGSADLRIATNLGDAGPLLDARAKAEYRKRRAELRAELTEAEGNNDPGAINRIREELEMVDDQLSEAVSLGGRDRKAADHSERTRSRVARAIRGSLNSIRENDASLGHHLSTCIRTGYACSYHPDPEGSLTWQL